MMNRVCLIALFTSDLTVIETQSISDRDSESMLRQRTLLLNQAISVETNVIASNILKGKRFSAKDISHEKGTALFPPEFSVLLGEDGLIALEVFPLHVGHQPLGLMAIARDDGYPYTEEDISFVSSLASSIALAIHNARLFEQLSVSQNQLRGLSQQLVQIQENQLKFL